MPKLYWFQAITLAVSITRCYRLFALKQYGIPVKGPHFNGVKDIYSKEYILNYTGIPFLGISQL